MAQSPESGQCEGETLVYFEMGRKAESDTTLKRSTAQEGSYWPSAIGRIHAFLRKMKLLDQLRRNASFTRVPYRSANGDSLVIRLGTLASRRAR